MPTKKPKRNTLGSITPVDVIINGKRAVRYDAKKRYTGADGQPAKPKFKRCRSYAEAQVQLHNFKTEIEQESVGDTGPVTHTFFKLCDYFNREHVKPPVFVGDRQIGGYRQDLNTLRKYISDYKEQFGNPDLERITYEDIRRYAEKLATTPIVSPKGKVRMPKYSTLNKKLGFLRHILYVGTQLKWLDDNPFTLGDKRLIDPSAEIPRDRALTFDEEELLLASCEGPDVYEYTRKATGKTVRVQLDSNPRAHLKPAVIFAIESGMRKKEMFTTRRSQVDLDNYIIELNAKQTKALKRRFIVISDRLAAEFRKLFSTRFFHSNDLIFGGARNFDRSFRTACRRAGIADLLFHDLRHTASTWMDEAGISEPVRRNMVGHDDRRTGQRYINPTIDVLASSRVKMNEFRQKQEERRRQAAAT